MEISIVLSADNGKGGSNYMNDKCDLCEEEEAKYDARTHFGSWAKLCQKHFDMYATKNKGTYTTLANIGKPGRKPYSD
jgi:hypothetical protein